MKFSVPLFIIIPRKRKADRKVIINLNNYPHWHYMTYNKVKELFCEARKGDLTGLKLKHPITLAYTLYKGSNRKSDRMNVLAVIDKFFCDSLTAYGCLPDDTDEYISSQQFKSGGLDRTNPRVEIEIAEK